MLDRQTPIKAFRDKERWQYSATDQNMFAVAIGQINRYYEFLMIVKARYDSETKSFIQLNPFPGEGVREGVRQVTTDEIDRMIQSSALQANIQLDIESFYVFAKVTLDKIAQFCEIYFGNQRGCTFKSHDNLVRYFSRYIEAKELSFPTGFLELSEKLKDLVSEFRDKHIAHHKNPRRMVGISWSADGDIKLMPTYVNPKQNDKPQMASSPLSQLLELVDAYLEMLFSAIEKNRTKGTFTIKEGTPGTQRT
jgi:hypothetical protein